MNRTCRTIFCTKRQGRVAESVTIQGVGSLRNSTTTAGCLRIRAGAVLPVTTRTVLMICCTGKRKAPVSTVMLQLPGNRRISIMSSGSGLTVLILQSAVPAMKTRETTGNIPVTGAMNIQGAVLRQSTGKKELRNSATAPGVTGAVMRMRRNDCGGKNADEFFS